MPSTRRIVYIRAADRRPLYFRFIGGRFHLVLRVLYPDRREHHSFHIAVGDCVEIDAIGRIIRLEIGEDSVLTEEPEFAALDSPLHA